MNDIENKFEEEIISLINEYGKLDFLEQASNKQKVTRQLINRAKLKLRFASFFFYSVSIAVIICGLFGFKESNPVELTFLIPLGIVMFVAVNRHANKSKSALIALSRLSNHNLNRL